jgi:hypothetical protein
MKRYQIIWREDWLLFGFMLMFASAPCYLLAHLIIYRRLEESPQWVFLVSFPFFTFGAWLIFAKVAKTRPCPICGAPLKRLPLTPPNNQCMLWCQHCQKAIGTGLRVRGFWYDRRGFGDADWSTLGRELLSKTTEKDSKRE